MSRKTPRQAKARVLEPEHDADVPISRSDIDAMKPSTSQSGVAVTKSAEHSEDTQSDDDDPMMQDMGTEYKDQDDVRGSNTVIEGPDDVEEELQRLIFGDDVGFRRELESFAAGSAKKSKQLLARELPETTGTSDGALFFTDTAGSTLVNASEQDGLIVDTEEHSSDEDNQVDNQPAVWHDSDDDRLMVSLASIPMLRKLRKTEAEDVISGREYTRRLRQRYEILHPRPAWAMDAVHRASKKRRLSRDSDASSQSEVVSEGEDSEQLMSVTPLARLMKSSSSLVKRSEAGSGRRRRLRPEVLDIQRTRDIAGVQPSAITSLSFHPDYPLLLSSGPSSTLYLHHIALSPPAPLPNPLLTSLHVKGAALTTTAFHPHDSRIFLSARRRYFHVWDLQSGRVEKIARVYGQQHEQRTMERFKLSPDGKYMALLGSARKGGGTVNILDASSLQWSSQVRVESRGGIADFAWWSDSRGMCIAGKNGEVTEWDVVKGIVAARWHDQGAVGTSVLALGGHNGQANSAIGSDRWVAIGSSSGIVNIYDRKTWLESSTGLADFDGVQVVPQRPTPAKVMDHLTTPTSHLVFSPDGQLLVMSSRWKKDALRLVHLPTCTVYKNWPTSSTPLGRITGVAFSGLAEDGMENLAVANEAGKIRLWEIRS